MSRTPFTRRAAVAVAASLLAAANLGGCVIEIDPPPPSGGGGGGGGGTPTTIRVVLINDTSLTLDPQIYVTENAVTDLDHLFTRSNKYTRYGIGTIGLLGGRDSDSFTLACDDTRVLGTLGGAFGDDLDNPEGTGQQRVVSQDVNFECGETITLRFSQSGAQFRTTVTISQ